MDHAFRTGRSGRLRARCASPIAGALAATALAAALPASSNAATAATPASSAAALAPLSITPGELAKVELSALGLSEHNLVELISKLPGEAGSEAALTPLVASALAAPGTTVGELVESVQRLLGGTATPAQLVEEVLSEASTPASVATLLADIAPSLNSEQLGELEGLVGRLLGELSPAELEGLESKLGASSPSELASDLVRKLAAGSGTSSLQTLLEELGQLTTTTGGQLAEATSGTVESLAKTLGVAPQALSESTGLSSVLPSREVLYVLGGPEGEGITLGVTPASTKAATGPGTTRPSTTTTNTTTNNYYPAPATATTPTTAAKHAKAKRRRRRVRIVGHSVRKHVLTLVVKTPAAGKVVVQAPELKRMRRRVGRAKKVVLRIRLSRMGHAAVARRHRHHHRLTVKVKAIFKPRHGRRSKATARARFS